ncbi:STAS domain-containing protein [Streptomyces sp. NPDC001286]
MHAEQLLQTRSQHCGRSVVLRVTGELDVATAPLLDEAVAACLAQPTRFFYADLSQLTFCDATGFQALQRMTRAVHAGHATFHLLGIHPNLRRALTTLQALAACHTHRGPPWHPPNLKI